MDKRPQRGKGRTCAALSPALDCSLNPSRITNGHPVQCSSHIYVLLYFVLLPFANSIIFAKRGKNTNGYKRNTKTLAKQHLRRFERVQAEHRRVQAEYKNLTGMPSRTVQTSKNGVQTSTNGIQTNRIQTDYKTERNDILDGTDDQKRSTNGYKRIREVQKNNEYKRNTNEYKSSETSQS